MLTSRVGGCFKGARLQTTYENVPEDMEMWSIVNGSTSIKRIDLRVNKIDVTPRRRA